MPLRAVCLSNIPLSIHPAVCPFTSLSTHPPTHHPSCCPSIHPPRPFSCLSILPSFCLPIHSPVSPPPHLTTHHVSISHVSTPLSIRLPVSPSTPLSVHPTMPLPAHPTILGALTGLSTHPPLCPSLIHLSAHPSVLHPTLCPILHASHMHPSIHPSIHPCLSFIHPSVHLSVHPSTHLCLSFHLPLCPFSPSVPPPLCQSIHPPLSLRDHVSHPLLHLSLRLSICLSGCPSARLSICPCTSCHSRHPLLSPHTPHSQVTPVPVMQGYPLAQSPWEGQGKPGGGSGVALLSPGPPKIAREA